VAQTVFNCLGEGGAYEAVLELSFGAAGRTGMGDLLEQARGAAPGEVSVQATFDRPSGDDA
jgi:hypothetical protein